MVFVVCMVCRVGMIRMVCPYSRTGISYLGLKVAGSRTLQQTVEV